MERARKKLGLIINPLAGIGGRVGLKGSDGEEIVKKAIAMGAVAESPNRAREALERLTPYCGQVEILTYPAEMGQDVARACGFEAEVLGSIERGRTTAGDTRRAAQEIADHGAELILFVGGDGTARDVCEAIGEGLPVLGIPAGVKIHSSVFAINPRKVADLVAAFLGGHVPTRAMEVMDIDEDLFRGGQVSARLYGYLNVPYERSLIQSAKASSRGSASFAKAIAESVVDDMSDPFLYVLGPGTTVKAIGDELGIDKTLLGVDVVQRRRLVGKDVDEEALLATIAGRQARIVVTVIGGQGYIFGRGNQQISPRVIRMVGKKNLIIVATTDKLIGLQGPLRVDTGDDELDMELSGYLRVTTGYREESMWRVEG
jgi:predicted polyphosphate/ATP-dependent NAD kinase